MIKIENIRENAMFLIFYIQDRFKISILSSG